MKSYLSINGPKILCIYLLALAAATFIPNSAFAAIPFDKVWDRIPSSYQLVGISALLLFLIVSLKERVKTLWKRYRNTVRAVRPRFSYHDYLIWLISFFILLLILKHFVSFWTFAGVSAGTAFLISLLMFFQKETSVSETTSQAIWFSDEPIKDEGQDLLGRTPFVQSLYEHITGLPFADSFVFGLSGDLGEGKTSVINLLKKKFRGDETHLIVDYDPWNFTDEKTMLPAFYNEMEKAISKNLLVPGFRRTLVRYQKLLSPEISPFGIKLGFKVDESLDDVKARIENYIIRTRKKLIIIIDDIDRLEPKEILQILKLVRLSAKFKNTIFILLFDRNRVREKLKSYADVDEEYIEKFIQRYVPLPAAEHKALENYLDVHLEKLWEELGLTKEEKKAFEQEFAYLYHKHVKKIFRNLRKTKIYLNSLRATLPPIHKEVNIFDFAVLELIKVFYPNVHADIWRSPEFYLPFEWSDDAFLQSPFFLERDENAKYQRIKEHIEKAVEGEPEKELILHLLVAIFPVHLKGAFAQYGRGISTSPAQTYRVRRRATHPESFVKYFMLDVPSPDIPDDELYQKLEQWRALEGAEREREITESFFAFQRQGKLAAFLKKLNVFRNEIPQELVPAIITAVYRNANRFSTEGGGFEHLFRSEWDKALALLLTLIDEKVERQEINRFIEEVALNTPHITLAVLIVLYSTPGRDGGGSLYNIYNAVDNEALRARVSERLRSHFVDSGLNLFEEYPNRNDWSFIVYQWSTNWMTNTGDNHRVFNDYLITLFDKDTKNLMIVLGHSQGFQNPEELRQVYDVEQIKAVITTYLDEDRLNDDERAAAEKFLASHPTTGAAGQESQNEATPISPLDDMP